MKSIRSGMTNLGMEGDDFQNSVLGGAGGALVGGGIGGMVDGGRGALIGALGGGGLGYYGGQNFNDIHKYLTEKRVEPKKALTTSIQKKKIAPVVAKKPVPVIAKKTVPIAANEAVQKKTAPAIAKKPVPIVKPLNWRERMNSNPELKAAYNKATSDERAMALYKRTSRADPYVNVSPGDVNDLLSQKNLYGDVSLEDKRQLWDPSPEDQAAAMKAKFDQARALGGFSPAF